MRKLQCPPVARHGLAPTNFPETLQNTSHVFLRQDHVRSSLEAPYRGPYRILARTDKTVTIQLPDRTATVSWDRTKAAFTPDILASSLTETSNSIPLIPVTTTPACTRSGRTVRFPDYLRY